MMRLASPSRSVARSRRSRCSRIIVPNFVMSSASILVFTGQAMKVTNVPPPIPAEAFRAWRRSLGVTQVAAAELLSLSERAIKHYEGGTRAVSAQVAAHCAAIARRRKGGPGNVPGWRLFEARPNTIRTPHLGCRRIFEIVSPLYRPSTILDPAAGDGR